MTPAPPALSKTQLDKLGERLQQGELNRETLASLARFRNAFIASTNSVAAQIAFCARGFRCEITQRPAKSTPSIIAKLRRESCRLTQIQDIGGVRVIVSKISVQDRVVKLIRQMYPEARIIDRRKKPQYGYRAVHVIVRENGCLVEVQVRTRIQDSWAQYSEKLSDIYDQDIKYGGGPEPMSDELKYLARYCADVEKREVELDEYKKAEINRLNSLRRGGRLTPAGRRRLESYRKLLAEKRDAKAAMLRYVEREIGA